MMIKKLFKIFKKPKPTLIWLHIEQRQYYGVIGWLANDRKTFVKGEDNFHRLGMKG